jgi:hypothetical protein
VLAAIDGLRQGGFVIVFRHGETGRVSFDRPTAVMGDCSTQRNLDEVGRAQVRQLGEDFKALRIPVGKVLTSEFLPLLAACRGDVRQGRLHRHRQAQPAAELPSVTEADRRKSNADLAAMLSEKRRPAPTPC